MVTKRTIIALVSVLIVLGVILCLTQVSSHVVTSCGQAVLPIILLLSTYLLLYKLSLKIPIIAFVMIGSLWKPPRLT
jgi:hypothetical protein